MSITAIKPEKFVKKWKTLSTEVRGVYLKNLSYHQLKHLYEAGVLNQKEVKAFKMRFPRQFKITDFSQDEIKLLSLTYSADYFMYAKDPDQDYIEHWIVKNYNQMISMKLIIYVLKCNRMSLNQKLDFIYNTLWQTVENKDYLDEILKVVQAQPGSKKLIYALCTVIGNFVQLSHEMFVELCEETMNFVTSYYDRARIRTRILSSVGKATYNSRDERDFKFAKHFNKLFHKIEIGADEYGNPITKQRQNEAIAQELLDGIQQGVWTMDFIKHCHLENYLSRSQILLDAL